MRFLIIGGDAAGMSAASRAKRNMPNLQVTVLEQTDDVSYSACGMPYNIADPVREIDDLIVRKAEVFREKQHIDLRTGHRADSIHVRDRKVTGKTRKGEDFEIPYDKLLIATGASAIIPPLPGFDLPGVMALKNLEDGRKIKRFMGERNVSRVVIVGMGYIGLEMCESLRARGIEVNMIKPRPVFLPWMNFELAAIVRKELDTNGVGVYVDCRIDGIQEWSGGLKMLSSGPSLDCQMVLAAIGVMPNSQLAEEAGLELGQGKAIAVDRALLTSDENIYAGGDCADAFHVVTGNRVYIPLALRANRAGWAVADNVTGKRTELPGVVGTTVFRVFDLEVARTGLSMKEAEKAGFEPAETVIHSRSRAHAHPGSTTISVQMVGDRKSGRLLGVQMVGKEGVAHRVNAPAVALHAGMTVEQFGQSDLAYAPPFSPVWDPMLTAANQLLKEM